MRLRLKPPRNLKSYYLKVRGAVIEPGDRVLVTILAFDGKHKLADRWEDDVYIVLSQPNQDIPVFVVRRENGEGRERTLHRDIFCQLGVYPPQISQDLIQFLNLERER